MRTHVVALAVAGALISPAVASAANPAATAIRVGNHPGFVRVVLDRSPTPAPAEYAIDSTINDGRAIVDVPNTRIGALRAVSASGVTVTPIQRGSTLRLRLTAAPGTFKYYGDFRLSGRLVMDLWKTRPVYPAATRRDAGCLAIGTVSPGTGKVNAAGRAYGIFESQFSVVIRNQYGRIVGRRAPVFVNGFPGGTWSTTVTYEVARRQIGTLEAVDFGGRVGELCLAQIPVILRAG